MIAPSATTAQKAAALTRNYRRTTLYLNMFVTDMLVHAVGLSLALWARTLVMKRGIKIPYSGFEYLELCNTEEKGTIGRITQALYGGIHPKVRYK